MKTACKKILFTLLGLSLSSFASSNGAEPIQFNIPQQQADTALILFAAQADLTLIIPYDQVKEKKTNRLVGKYSVIEAINTLLTDTGLQARFDSNKHLSISAVNPTSSIDDDAERSESSKHIEVITITATKRKTSLQNTPLSISALTADHLAKSGATSFIDYMASVPSLSLQDAGPGQRRPILRGLVGAGEPLVGTYIDEIPFTGFANARNDAGQFSADLRLHDVNRVEVLRGPQGTLYGSGSMGGTLRIILNQPDLENFNANLQAGLAKINEGKGSNYVVNGMVNMPLIKRYLALRLVGYYEDKAGWIDNNTLMQTDINTIKTVGFRGILDWDITDNLKATTTSIYQDSKLDGGTGLSHPRKLTTDIGAAEAFPDKFIAHNIKTEWHSELYSVVVSGSYFHQDSNQFSFGGDPPTPNFEPGLGINQANSGDISSFEARISSNYESPVNWVGGIFYQDRSNSALSSVSALNSQGEPGEEIFFFERLIALKMNQSAVFGEVTYDINQHLSATVGLRQFDISNFASTTVTLPIPPLQNPLNDEAPARKTTGNENDIIKKYLIDYQVTKEKKLYIQYAEGFRAGGANQNVGSVLIPDSFNSDSVKTYEVGLKTSWFDHKVVLNTAFYTTRWRGIQVNQRTPDGLFNFISNAGSAKVDGIEFEMTGVLSDHWKLSLNGAWTNARLTDDQPQTIDSGAIRTGLKGDPLPNIPEFSGSFQIEYSRALSDNTEYYIAASTSYRGRTQNVFRDTVLDPSTLIALPNSQFVDIDSYTLISFKTGLNIGNWQGSFYVDNFEDKRSVTNVTTPFGLKWRVVQPRTTGISVKWTY